MKADIMHRFGYRKSNDLASSWHIISHLFGSLCLGEYLGGSLLFFSFGFPFAFFWRLLYRAILFVFHSVPVSMDLFFFLYHISKLRFWVHDFFFCELYTY
jgi:hypothetical protein